MTQNRKDNGSFKTFRKNILKVEAASNTSVDERIIRRHFKYFWAAAALVALTNLFWIIRGVFHFNDPFNIIQSVVCLVYIVFSIFVAFTGILKIKKTMVLRVIMVAYYVLTIAFLTLLTVNRNMTAASENSEMIGVDLATLYIFLLVFFPTPYVIDAVILLVTAIVSLFIPLSAPGSEKYSLINYVLTYIFAMAGYGLMVHINRYVVKKEVEIEKLNDDLIDAAHMDILTNALNRRSLDEYTKYIKNNNDISTLGVIMFDIDFFKSYNDTYSHIEGDGALRKVCELVNTIITQRGCYLFRYGGEEFVTILLNPKEEELIDLATDINAVVYNANIARNDGCRFDRITITVGTSIISKNKSDFISSSDKQLYVGKNGTKNCVVYKNKAVENNKYIKEN